MMCIYLLYITFFDSDYWRSHVWYELNVPRILFVRLDLESGNLIIELPKRASEGDDVSKNGLLTCVVLVKQVVVSSTTSNDDTGKETGETASKSTNATNGSLHTGRTGVDQTSSGFDLTKHLWSLV